MRRGLESTGAATALGPFDRCEPGIGGAPRHNAHRRTKRNSLRAALLGTIRTIGSGFPACRPRSSAAGVLHADGARQVRERLPIVRLGAMMTPRETLRPVDDRDRRPGR
ncbi:MAG TPA: hypothetical protein DCQ98_21595 [Planctomycetaceae bacterium]|nr:hypothetical protein [Planctomycetaceae bacterium]